MTHAELCLKTAEYYIKKAHLVLYEYQSFANAEFPDVLVFGERTSILLEIKMSHADFLADAKKDARKKYKTHWNLSWCKKDQESTRMEYIFSLVHPELYYKEAPHLGRFRYFVCEPGVIKIEEVPEGWGLIYYEKNRFKNKKESRKWRNDIHAEKALLVHAFRRFANGNNTGIVVRPWK